MTESYRIPTIGLLVVGLLASGIVWHYRRSEPETCGLRQRQPQGTYAACEDEHARADAIDRGRGQWRIVSIDNDELDWHGVVRFRVEDFSHEETTDYPIAILVRWPYTPAPGSRFPPRETRVAMDAFEEALDGLKYAPDLSYLLIVTTDQQAKEWCFYARNASSFMERFNQLLQGKDRCPVEIESRSDSHWDYWRSVAHEPKISG